MIISLTGFMGCGKSSVGRRLSTLLSCSYADLDSIIEEAEGRSIPDIFQEDGEAAFRKMEVDQLRTLLVSQDKTACNLVLSLGGGTIMTEECASVVKELTLCIYLRASVYTLLSHLENESEGRPMLKAAEQSDGDRSEALRKRICELMEQRSTTYEKAAHIIIDTDGKGVTEICDEILEALGN